MCKILRLPLTIIVIVALAATCSSGATKKSTKAAPAKAAASKAPAGPKLLTVVAGQPFETVPATGSSRLSVTLCAEETAPATFTARYGKSMPGVAVRTGDFAGPGKITRENFLVRVVKGDRLASADNVEIGPNSTQFWVDVTAPKGTKPGTYTGNVGFFVQGKVVDVEPLQIVVRPIRLIGSSKQYALCTPVGLCAGVDGESYSRFLSGVAGLGFRAVSVNDEPAKMGDTLNACTSAGLLGSVPVFSFARGCAVPSADQVTAIEDARKAAGLGSVFCFCASSPASDDEVNAAVEKANVFRSARLKVGATIADDTCLQKLMPVVDGINYRYDMPYVQALVNGGTDRTDKWEWYWWEAGQSVSDNRIRAGLALWKSGLYGCMPMLTPAGDEGEADCLSSLECEALREGVNDTRYITTYMKALRELKDKKRTGDKDYIASTEGYLSAFLSKPLDKITPADLRGFREKMAEFSAKLAAKV